MKQNTKIIIFQLFFCMVLGNQLETSSNSQCVEVQHGIRRCGCDRLCSYYRDCCTEVEEAPIHLPPPSCQLIKEVDRKVNVFIWSKCPSSYPSILIKQKCENPHLSLSQSTPVYSWKLGLLFYNRYCAECNGFIQNDISHPNITHLICKREVKDNRNDLEFVNNLIEKGICHLGLQFPSGILRQCHPLLVEHCPNNATLETQSGCFNEATWYAKCGQQPSVVYKNKKCAVCNIPDCVFVASDGLLRGPSFKGYFYPYDMLLDFYKLGIQPESTPAPGVQFSGITRLPINTTSSKNTTITVKSFIPYLLTTICVSLSGLFLLILIIVYSSIKKLHNSAGVMTIILALCMLCALGTYSGARYLENFKWPCRIIAEITHFFHLSIFFWTSLYAFDLLRTFRSQSLSLANQSKRKLGKYALFGFGMPLILTGVATAFDSTMPHVETAPNFGYKLCWFNKRWALIVWFFLPVVLTIAFNLCVCFALFRYFCITRNDVKSARRHSKKHLFLLCIKVTIVLGATWSLSISAVFIGNYYLEQMASVVTSLQGFFISLCFLLSKRTLNLCGRKLSRSKSTQYSRATRSSTRSRSSMTHSSYIRQSVH